MGNIGTHVDLTLPVVADIKQINRSAVNGQNLSPHLSGLVAR